MYLIVCLQAVSVPDAGCDTRGVGSSHVLFPLGIFMLGVGLLVDGLYTRVTSGGMVAWMTLASLGAMMSFIAACLLKCQHYCGCCGRHAGGSRVTRVLSWLGLALGCGLSLAAWWTITLVWYAEPEVIPGDPWLNYTNNTIISRHYSDSFGQPAFAAGGWCFTVSLFAVVYRVWTA